MVTATDVALTAIPTVTPQSTSSMISVLNYTFSPRGVTILKRGSGMRVFIDESILHSSMGIGGHGVSE
jgi:hypothetical protein